MMAIYSEKSSAVRYYQLCDIYSITMHESIDVYDYKLVISMLVFDLHDENIQTHYHIVKDIAYIFSRWFFSGAQVKYSSKLLHVYICSKDFWKCYVVYSTFAKYA